MRALLRSFARGGRAESGVAAVEFALIAPFMLILLLGGYELARFIVVQQKAEKMAFSIADVVTQFDADEFDVNDVNLAFSATAQIMKPYTFGADGRAILSSVYKDPKDQKPKVKWQCKTTGLTNTSAVGAVGADATLPASLTLEDKDNVVVSEVYYKFTPLLKKVITQPIVIYRVAMFRPRLGQLTASPGCT